ncbi:MAG: hypothetical protein K5829_14040 [Treponema sp.]|nr:hypothetical protein [Treponema sp.]
MQKSGSASFSISPKVLKTVSERAILLEESQENLSLGDLKVVSSTISVTVSGASYSETKNLSLTQNELDSSEDSQIDIVFDDITVGTEVSASATITTTYSIGSVENDFVVAEGSSDKLVIQAENNELNLVLKSKSIFERNCVFKFYFQTELNGSDYEENTDYTETITLGSDYTENDFDEIINKVLELVKDDYKFKETVEPADEDYLSGEDLVYKIKFDKIGPVSVTFEIKLQETSEDLVSETINLTFDSETNTFTAKEGFATYEWLLDGEIVSDATTNSYEVSSELDEGYHTISVEVADENDEVYSSSLTFELIK